MNIVLKEKVVALRRRGLSYGEIARETGAHKSSISNWCRDIDLSYELKKQILKRHRHKAVAALLKVAERRRNIRKHNLDTWTSVGRRDISNFSRRDLLMIGLGLYWGEGYKKGNEEFGFTNSDPYMILFVIHWLNECYGINKNQLTFRISINQIHATRVIDVENYWAQLISAQLAQFTKTSLIKAKFKKEYSNLTEHFGTLRIKVQKGTNLRRRILGSIALLSQKTIIGYLQLP